MSNSTGKILSKYLLSLLVVFGAALIRRLGDFAYSYVLAYSVYALDLVYIIFMVAFWTIYIMKRVVNKNVTNYIIQIAVLIILWFLIRSIKYYLVVDMKVLNYLWYSYYIPMLLMPVAGICGCLQVTKSEEYSIPLLVKGCYLISLIFILIVFSNNTHHFVFRFEEVFNKGDIYTYGPGYFIIVGWVAVMSLAFIIIFVKRTSVSSAKKRFWIVSLPLVQVCLYAIIYICHIFEPFTQFLDMTLVISSSYMTLWILLIEAGFIPTNSNYDKLLENSNLSLAITDENYNVVYNSKDALDLSYSQYEQAANSTFPYNENISVNSMKLEGGYGYWKQDFTLINSMIKELNLIQSRLTETNEMLQAEIALNARNSRIQIANMLYDSIAIKLKDFTDEIKSIVRSDLDLERKYKNILIRGAFIKRYANLMILAFNNPYCSNSELSFCLKESCDALSNCGIKAIYYTKVKDNIAINWIMEVYRYINELIFAGFDNLKEMYVTIEENIVTVKFIDIDSKQIVYQESISLKENYYE